MKKAPFPAFMLAWLLPGAGHWYIGQRGKAVTFCFVLVTIFALGVLLTEGGCVDLGRHPWAFILQVCAAGPALVALTLTAGAHEMAASKLADLGMLLTLVGGALNVLLIADAVYRSAPEQARDET